MFIAGNGNGRVEVFRLKDDGTLAQPTAEYVLGKPSDHARRTHAGDFSEEQTEFPGTLAVDHVNQRLFLVDNATGHSFPGVGSQIMIFDIDPDRIETGQPVLAILGQPDAETKTIGLAANHTGRRLGLAVDEDNQRLFVADGMNHRVLVFDIRPDNLKTGMDASLVLGQSDFTSKEPGLSANELSRPSGLAFDRNHQRLFVSDNGNRRVLVFDARPDVLESFAAAADVMGQPDFETNSPRRDLNGFATGGLTYDDKTDRLFIAEQVPRIEHMRITVYDVAPGKRLSEAKPLAVLGKPGFGSYDPIVSREQSVWPRLGSASIDPERQLLVATEGYPGGNRAIIWDVSPEHLRNGLPAVEVVGHLNDDGHTDFERRAANDRATPRNVYPRDVELDPVDHRLFAIDQYNNRVLVWQLDSQNRVLDRDAHWVLGQPDLYSGELYPIGPTTIKIPLAVTYDPHHKRAFVSDGWGNRIMVFDAHPDRLKNGPEAIAVLGQPDFTSTSPATNRTGINLDTRVGTGITPSRPRGAGLAYDPIHDRVFVSDGGNHRVLVYDVAPEALTNGMPASVVLGQPDFTSSSRNATPTGLYQPAALRYDAKNHRLFVSDGNNNRVLVFDARPDVLANGAEPKVVIGQPDFSTFEPSRSRSGIDGPDGLAYDTKKDRLFVSDHGSDRILVFDAHPSRLDNGPEALFVIGQSDFETRELGPVREDEMWDPRGLAFDSSNQRLYVSEGFASNIMIHDLARSVWERELPSRGVQIYQSASPITASDTQRGFTVASGSDGLAGGSAVVTMMKAVEDPMSQRDSRILLSEAGVPATSGVRDRTVYVDANETRVSIANPGDAPIRLALTLYDASGGSVATSEREVAAGTSSSVAAGEVGTVSSGALRIRSEHEFFMSATRLTENTRGEPILAAAPSNIVANAERVTIPRLRFGGGYRSRVVLLNPTDEAVDGGIMLFRPSGEPLDAIAAAIAPRGTFVWEPDADSLNVHTAFAVVSGGVASAALLSYEDDGNLLSQHLVSAAHANETWFPIDTYPSVVRHGKSEVRLSIANGVSGTADIRFIVYDQDGNLVDRSYQILPPGRQVEMSHVDLVDRGKFKGSVRIVSDVPIAVSAELETVNVRNESVVSGLPSMFTGASGRVVFPDYADGADTATELFLLNRGAAGATSLEFFSSDGGEMAAILR